MAECTWCGGTGFISQGLGAETCPECLGTGEVDGDDDDFDDDLYAPDYTGTYAVTPSLSSSTGSSGAKKTNVGGCFTGGCGGCAIGLFSMLIGMGLAGIPVVGWIFAIGFIGAGFVWPLLGAWLGSRGGK